jgi:hypothetical protein
VFFSFFELEGWPWVWELLVLLHRNPPLFSCAVKTSSNKNYGKSLAVPFKKKLLEFLRRCVELYKHHNRGCHSRKLSDMGGQAPLKFVLPPEKSRHGADTIYKLGLHHKYTMKINYKGQVIWVLQFYSQATEDP